MEEATGVDGPGETPTGSTTPSRRQVLAGAATATAGLAVGAPVSAQEGDEESGARYTLRLVLPQAREFQGNYEGQFVIISDPLQSAVDRQAIENCAFADWSPDQSEVYEVVVLDRLKEKNPPMVKSRAFMNAQEVKNIQPGDTFIIQMQKDCPDRYIGLEITRLSPRKVGDYESASQNTETDAVATTGTTGGSGPGFGATAGAAGVTLGALWRALRGA